MTARRLVAILVADVVGFSRLMERDDAGTLARLQTIRSEIVDPAVAGNGGRIVKTTGDGMLAEFASADASLRCALAVQRALAQRNEPLTPDERIELRIGINLGDIIVEGDDIFGDGVNVAARLESLAPAGGICVSAAVRDQVHGNLDAEFVDAGEQRVKNIARPIRSFTVDLALGAPPRSTAPAQASVRAMSVGVMPFVSVSEDAVMERAAKAIGRDFTAMLARCGSLISVRSVSPTGAADVRYLAEGDVQRMEDATVVEVRLVDAATGEQFWGAEASLLRSDDATIHARRLHAVAWQLSRALITVEIRRITAQPEAASTPLDSVILAHALDRTEPDVAKRMLKKEELLEDALRRDPNSVPALLGLAIALDLRVTHDIDAECAVLVRRMDELTAKAVRLNDIQPVSWLLRSTALMYGGQWQAALEACARSIALEPYSTFLLMQRAWLILMCGRPGDALSVVEEAVAMGHQANATQMRVACEASLLLGRYAEAIETGEKSLGHAAVDEFDAQLSLAAAYANAGEMKKAAAARDTILRLQPRYTLAICRSRRYSRHPQYVELLGQHLYPGLRKAGLPEA